MKKTLLISIAVLLFTIAARGQDRKISGKVTEENGTGFPGVYIKAEGTDIISTTNVDGFYEIIVPQETDKLNFSYIGFKEQQVDIKDHSVINVILKKNTTEIGAVEIQGFASVITLARRRIENMQTTPESIIAITSEDIENSGIKGLPDFLSAIPNASFTSSQNIGTNSLTVRGITQLRNAEAPVAVIIDGVNILNPSMLDQEMFDIEQIELIKGPQGALYGRNAIGGVLNIITKKPTNTFSNFIKLGYANGNTFNTVLGSSGPIIKNKLLYRIAASYNNSDGLIENDFLHQKVDFYNNKSARAQLIYNITNNFSADIIVNYTKTEGGAVYYTIGNSPLLESLGGNNGVTDTLTADNTSINPMEDELGESLRTIADGSIRLNYALPFGRITSTTAYSKIDYDLNSEGISQEIRLSSNTNKKLSWVFGANYQIAERELKTLGEMSSAGAFAGMFGLPQTDFEKEVLYPILDAQELNINTTLAFFGQASYKLGDNTEFAVGLRYDSDIREQTNLVDNSIRKHTFTRFQPKVNFSYQVTPRIFSFVSYGSGYRSGGFNAPTIIRYPELYEAEYTNNYELGIKTNWLNNRVIANFDVFFIDFKNTQMYLVELDGGGQIIVNLGSTQNIGAELDMKFRLTKNLDLYLSGGVINPKITETGSSIPESLSSDFTGNYSPQVNLNNTNSTIQYSVPLNKKNTILIRAEHEHRGKLYWHPDNVDVQPATEFLNFRTYFKHKAKYDWQIGIFVNNLLDVNYAGEYVAVEYSGAPFGDLRWPGKPRSFGMNLSLKF